MSVRHKVSLSTGPLAEVARLIARRRGIPAQDIEGREWIVTEERAAYDAPTLRLLSINGSPPRGTIVLSHPDYADRSGWLYAGQRFHTLTARELKIVLKAEMVLFPNR